MKYICEKAPDKYGGAGIEIRLLYETASKAENSFEERIAVDHVNSALKSLEKSNILDYITTLPAQQKILPISLAKKY